MQAGNVIEPCLQILFIESGHINPRCRGRCKHSLRNKQDFCLSGPLFTYTQPDKGIIKPGEIFFKFTIFCSVLVLKSW